MVGGVSIYHSIQGKVNVVRSNHYISLFIHGLHLPESRLYIDGFFNDKGHEPSGIVRMEIFFTCLKR